MKFLPLVWAMLWRSKARTWLTFLSITVAFLLFGALQSAEKAFNLGVRLSGDDRLVTSYKQGLTKLLPMAYRQRIESLDPDILVAQPIMFLPGSWQDPKNQLQIVAIPPETLVLTDPRVRIPADQQRAFESNRNAIVVGEAVAKQHGWKIGDRIPVQSPVQRKDGAQVWDFELVGIFDLDPALTAVDVPVQTVVMHLDNYNEAATYNNLVVWYTVRVKDPKRATEIGKRIDAHFRNSEFETRTQSEADFQRGFVRQLGNVGKMMTAILGAVFFTLVLVAGNTMMQAFRERVPELAVLKTLGFRNDQVAVLIAAESMLLCGFAGAVGLGIVLAALPHVPIALGPGAGGLPVESSTMVSGLLLALAVGLVSAAIPAWRSARLTVVDGLVQS